MVSNGKIMKNFDEITHKTPHRLFLEKFPKFSKFSKIFENPPPPNHFLLHFSERNFGRVGCSIGQKANFMLLGHPRGRSPQKIPLFVSLVQRIFLGWVQ